MEANEPCLGRWVHDDASGLEGLVIEVKTGGWRVVLSVVRGVVVVLESSRAFARGAVRAGHVFARFNKHTSQGYPKKAFRSRCAFFRKCALSWL